MYGKYLGEIFDFAGNYAPIGSQICDGTLLNIAQYRQLFQIIGTTYGGDGVLTFALPDLMGRSSIGTGTGSGLTTFTIGDIGGIETKQLSTNELPTHNHTASLKAQQLDMDSNDPEGHVLGGSGSNTYSTVTTGADIVDMYSNSIIVNNKGNSQPFAIRNPYLALTKCIVIAGEFPNS